jgi:predicted amidohydrolase
MEQAHRRGGEIVVFPEPALTTFFPRHYHADIAEADGWFEAAMPSNETAPLFAAPRRYGYARITAQVGAADPPIWTKKVAE